MKIQSKKSFVAGILTTLSFFLLWWLLANAKILGVHTSDSPSGKYSLAIISALEKTDGGKYEIRLIDKSNNKTLRKVVLQVAADQSTESVRGGNTDIRWNATETKVEVIVKGEPLLELPIPSA